MKMPFLLRSLWTTALFLLMFDAIAEPILPYQQPIAQQLQNDITAGSGDLNTLNRALSTYNRTSRSLASDIGILRDLNALLASNPNYPSLLSNAANAYLGDFQGRRDQLAEQLRPAPRSATKTSAQMLLRKLNASLSNAVVAADIPNTTTEIKHLLAAAGKIPQTSNTIQRALRAPIGLSSVSAQIGALRFTSGRGGITGGPTFQSDPGTAVGEFGSSNGILTFSAFDNGSIARAIHLHVEGITSNTPATYPLGIGNNSAFYRATDLSHRREYHFQCDPALTNGLVTNAFLTVDFINTNYLLGRFGFVGTNAHPIVATDTNTTASIHRGEFQLNFKH
jgi:hypothetical protein